MKLYTLFNGSTLGYTTRHGDSRSVNRTISMLCPSQSGRLLRTLASLRFPPPYIDYFSTLSQVNNGKDDVT